MIFFLCIESIFLGTIINMVIIFHFMFKMLKKPILKVELSRI
jgi:F0F1-type ATP synthase membrane subunit b/b'